MERQGVLGAIVILGELNEGNSDQQTHKMVLQIIEAMENKKRKLWPSKELRELVNKLDKLQYNLFLETLYDMRQGFEEYYGELNV